MQIKIDLKGFKQVQDALVKAPGQVAFATSLAINASAKKAKTAVITEMGRVFDRPTSWVLKSLYVKQATKKDLSAELAFKDAASKNTTGPDTSRTMIFPHVEGGGRHFKTMEARLLRFGLLPAGYNAVPGDAAKLDGNGNMSQGQISQLLNVLGTYTEAGYNKANDKTKKRLAKGNIKKNVYGFTYIVVKVGNLKTRHLQPGVYQRVQTGFGASIKPVLIFVKRANYEPRLDFYGITTKTINEEFPKEFNKAFDEAVRTALFKNQGTLL